MDRSARVVTASAGNHGRAVAWAAERLGLPAVVFTPAAAPQAKLGPIRAHGADLRPVATDYEDAERMAMAFARETGAVFISPYSHTDVIAGGGSVALEIRDLWRDVSTRLSSPSAAAASSAASRGSRKPSSLRSAWSASRPPRRAPFRPRGGQDASCRSRSARQSPTGSAATWSPETLTWEYVRDLVDEVVTVSETDWRIGCAGSSGRITSSPKAPESPQSRR